MLLAQSYGLTYAAYHGLGQGDMRYLWNFRTETFDPMVRDLDAGIQAPRPRVFVNNWVYMVPFAPLWRPMAVTIASYYLQYSEQGRQMYRTGQQGQPLFLWHTPPSTLRLM